MPTITIVHGTDTRFLRLRRGLGLRDDQADEALDRALKAEISSASEIGRSVNLDRVRKTLASGRRRG
jgi:hypothetical protein